MKKQIVLLILTLVGIQTTFAQTTLTPPDAIQQRVHTAMDACKDLISQERCYRGIYLVGSMGMGATVSRFSAGDHWPTLTMDLAGGVSFFDTVELGVEGTGLVYPLIFQTFRGGFYTKLNVGKWLYFKGRYYWLGGGPSTDMGGRYTGVEAGINIADDKRYSVGAIYEQNESGVRVYGLKFTADFGFRLVHFRRRTKIDQ